MVGGRPVGKAMAVGAGFRIKVLEAEWKYQRAS